jgi:1-acyl-sn-glycerol-3-phosphate acyltransferase
MLQKLIRAFRIALATLLISASTVVHVVPLMLVALIKAILRPAPVRRVCDRCLVAIAESWIGFNSWMLDHLTPTRVVVDTMPPLDRDGHYLVVCNHRSWVDIPVLQKIFNRRAPLLRFFLKSQLFWVPLLGLAWWALDFPFMKRYSKDILARRPELAGRDMEATRRACRKFSRIPVAVMNFVEGTRFSEAKREAQ